MPALLTIALTDADCKLLTANSSTAVFSINSRFSWGRLKKVSFGIFPLCDRIVILYAKRLLSQLIHIEALVRGICQKEKQYRNKREI